MATIVLAGTAVAEPRLDASAPRKVDAVPTQKVSCAGVAVFPIEGELECVPPIQVAAPAPASTASEHLATAARADSEGGAAPNYHALLDDLVITRDLEVPGVPVGVRLIPSRSALAGRSAKVALIPRFVGTNWYGAELIASF